MKRLFRYMIMLFAAGLLLLAPTAGSTQPADLTSGAPPVVQPLISEGDFAITLGTALGVITTDDDQIEAETKLGDLQIAPRNGWISDYPVTPDIIAELQKSVGNAADAERHARRDARDARCDARDAWCRNAWRRPAAASCMWPRIRSMCAIRCAAFRVISRCRPGPSTRCKR